MVEALEGIGAVDWNGLLLSMVQHERPWKRRLAHKMIFKALRHVPPRRCATGWMALLRRGA